MVRLFTSTLVQRNQHFRLIQPSIAKHHSILFHLHKSSAVSKRSHVCCCSSQQPLLILSPFQHAKSALLSYPVPTVLLTVESSIPVLAWPPTVLTCCLLQVQNGFPLVLRCCYGEGLALSHDHALFGKQKSEAKWNEDTVENATGIAHQIHLRNDSMIKQ